MGDIGQRIHEFIDVGAPRLPANTTASGLLMTYYGRHQTKCQSRPNYTGSLFDSSALQSPDPNRFTAHDVAAVATLSVPLSGTAVVGLVVHGDCLAELLAKVPADVSLAEATNQDLVALFAVQDKLDTIETIGHVTRSKLLAHKRPHLVPIRDQYVLGALLGPGSDRLTIPLRDALVADPSIIERLQAVRAEAAIPYDISLLRTLDVIVWMATHGYTVSNS